MAAPPAAVATPPPALASNEGERPRGSRAFALVLDDVGMVPRDAVEARRAVETFLGRSVRDGDEVSLATTSGEAWWSARLPEGREDLAAVIARVRGRGAEPSLSFDSMSDYEAFWIHNRESGTNGPMMRRVINRWLEAQVCLNPVGGSSQQERGTRLLESCPNMVRARAAAVDQQRRAHTRLTLGTVQRSLQALAPVRGRKSLLLFSRGFLQDSDPDRGRWPLRARRTRPCISSTCADWPRRWHAVRVRRTSAPIWPAGAIGFEDSTLESAGTRPCRRHRRFSIVNTTTAGGAERIAEESRLLPARHAPRVAPGEWRKLRVEVKGTVPAEGPRPPGLHPGPALPRRTREDGHREGRAPPAPDRGTRPRYRARNGGDSPARDGLRLRTPAQGHRARAGRGRVRRQPPDLPGERQRADGAPRRPHRGHPARHGQDTVRERARRGARARGRCRGLALVRPRVRPAGRSGPGVPPATRERLGRGFPAFGGPVPERYGWPRPSSPIRCVRPAAKDVPAPPSRVHRVFLPTATLYGDRGPAPRHATARRTCPRAWLSAPPPEISQAALHDCCRS